MLVTVVRLFEHCITLGILLAVVCRLRRTLVRIELGSKAKEILFCIRLVHFGAEFICALVGLCADCCEWSIVS
jgi:hypothetical protein